MLSPGAYSGEYSRGAYVDEEAKVCGYVGDRSLLLEQHVHGTISLSRTLERAVALKLVYLRIAISQVLGEYSAIMFAEERRLEVWFPGEL